MPQQTLAAALKAALKTNVTQESPRTPSSADWLVTALKNSTTRKDQIVQRRIDFTASSPGNP